MMSKQDQIQKYISELEEKIDDLEWGLSKALTDYEAKRTGILGEQKSLRLAIRRAKELIEDE